MGTAFKGIDVVGVAVDLHLEVFVVLKRHFHVDPVLFLVHVDHFRMDHAFVFVQHHDELGNTAFVVERFRAGFFFPFVREGDPHTTVQERQFPQTFCQRVPDIDRGLLKDFSIRVEGDLCTTVVDRVKGTELADGDAPFKTDVMRHAVPVDFHFHPVGERVHAGNTHAVQTAGNFVGIVVELTAGVEDRHNDFYRGDAQVFVHVNGNTAAVVLHGDAVILVDRDLHLGGIARQCFVDTVIHRFINKVMQTADAGVADIHTGAFADRFQPFQHGDLIGSISGLFRRRSCCRHCVFVFFHSFLQYVSLLFVDFYI